jgi:hypothetical protein
MHLNTATLSQGGHQVRSKAFRFKAFRFIGKNRRGPDAEIKALISKFLGEEKESNKSQRVGDGLSERE